VDLGSGAVQLNSAGLAASFDGVGSDRMRRAVARTAEEIGWRTGLPDSAADDLVIRIRCGQAGSVVPGIEEDEHYWLVVDDAGVYLDAATEWGVLRGLVTFVQLVRQDGSIPHAAVDDGPRFCWRGLLLDPARHPLSVDSLIRTLDGMALCKLNVLHLHLSDDQGFRFPVEAYPRLASAEAYTTAELERIVAHAADLGIRVVPEIDMPGHVTSWLTAYPKWGVRQVSATDRFGVHPGCLDPSSEEVYRAVDTILEALTAVFPDPCIHIGGDEVSPGWWSEDPAVLEMMHRESLTDVRQVQGYFNRRVAALVAARGRQTVAWDEVLESELPDSWIVQAWRGSTSRDRAADRGNRVIMSAPYYLDLNFPVDLHCRFDPAGPQSDLLAAEDQMLVDPRFAHVAEGIRWTRMWREGAVERDPPGSEVLGGEACLWGELVNSDVLDVRLWTRLPALAERFWSAPSKLDLTDLYRRLDVYLDQLHPLRGRDLEAWTTERLEGLGIERGWQELARMLEPVKWYGRLLGAEALAARIRGEEMPQSRPYGVRSRLDSVADFLDPESRPARGVAALCGRVAGGDEDAAQQLRILATRWQALGRVANDAPAGLQPLAERLAGLGDAVLSRLDEGSAIPLDQLDEIGRPVGELMIALPAGLRGWLGGL